MTPLEPLLRELLGEALRRRRRAQGRTLADVAAQAGMSMQHLSDVERGRKDPSSEMVAAICGALDLTLGQLMSLAGATAGAAGAERTHRTDRAVAPVILDLTGTLRRTRPDAPADVGPTVPGVMASAA